MDLPLHPDEYEVSQILLQLPQLIDESNYRLKFPISWGTKRKRSALMNPTPSIINPLFISTRKRFLKRNNKEWLEIVNELTRRRECLKTELENVKSHYEKQKALKIELIERKEELIKNQKQITINNLYQIPVSGDQEENIQISVIHESPRGIPDLNELPAETNWMEHCGEEDLAVERKQMAEAMAAEARQRRKQIYKQNAVIANKFRFVDNF